MQGERNPMSHAETPSDEGKQLPDRIKFDYIKSNLFRVVHAEGVIGGITPRPAIHMAFYNERNAIPRQTVFPVNEDGTLGPEITEERVVRDAIVREVEVDVVMDLNTAASFLKWLQEKLEIAEKMIKQGAQTEGS